MQIAQFLFFSIRCLAELAQKIFFRQQRFKNYQMWAYFLIKNNKFNIKWKNKNSLTTFDKFICHHTLFKDKLFQFVNSVLKGVDFRHTSRVSKSGTGAVYIGSVLIVVGPRNSARSVPNLRKYGTLPKCI